MASKANIALLDWAGVALAILMGALVAFFGSLSFLWLLLTFLVLSVIVTKYEHNKKRELGIYEHERSWENVLANGLVPTLCAVASGTLGWAPYVGSLAAITADKFASELGVLGGEPVSLLNFKKTKIGRNGAITAFGTLMSLDGALLVGIAAYFVLPGITVGKIAAIGLVGFAGSMVDSIVGVLEERGIGNKATTNFVCSLFGAVAGAAFL
ncbi:MAG: DUF92 domain-containing protein [Candidatus Micrarchaeota archaeon]|nr:DUF92 domain-containing protein [Candidatus Micrarchaeota archaeon]